MKDLCFSAALYEKITKNKEKKSTNCHLISDVSYFDSSTFGWYRSSESKRLPGDNDAAFENENCIEERFD